MDWVRDGEGLTSEEQLLWWWMWELLCGEEDQLRNVVLVIFLSIGNQGYQRQDTVEGRGTAVVQQRNI